MTRKFSILVADGDKKLRESILSAIDSARYRVIPVTNQSEALNCLEIEELDVLVTAIRDHQIDGLKLLEVAKGKNPGIAVILVTDRNTIDVDVAVKAVKYGASNFLTKPVDLDRLRTVISNVIESKGDGDYVESAHQSRLTGISKHVQMLRQKIARIAPTNATVLIQGESGTGKEVVARTIHRNSKRANKPFIAFNCAALNENLVESELFGHERGAFTGALNRKPGRFELAHEGTLFLDEIGEMDLKIQAKLLRAIETGEFFRVGGQSPIRVDVRIIAATNKDLESQVKRGGFREDLYHRLRVVVLRIPSLRERREDIPYLVEMFVEEMSRKNGKNVVGLTGEAYRAIMEYEWPGNVRELKNAIESAVILARGSMITYDDLPEHITRGKEGISIITTPEIEVDFPDPIRPRIRVGMTMREIEREIIKATLAYTDYNKTKAARTLDIGKKTLFRKLKAYNI